MVLRHGRTSSKLLSHCKSTCFNPHSTPHLQTEANIHPQALRRLAINSKYQQPVHLLRHNRNRHRQHPPLPRPTRQPALLLLRRPHPHPLHHLLKHNLPRLPHRLHRLPRELRSRPRYLPQQHTISATKSASGGSACKGDYVAVLGSAWLADKYEEWDLETVEG